MFLDGLLRDLAEHGFAIELFEKRQGRLARPEAFKPHLLTQIHERHLHASVDLLTIHDHREAPPQSVLFEFLDFTSHRCVFPPSGPECDNPACSPFRLLSLPAIPIL